jgi:hypothetical protein
MHHGRGLFSRLVGPVGQRQCRIRTECLCCLPGMVQSLIFLFRDIDFKLQIGRTSGLVLTLCGVLKDIMLVAFSILIWATPISRLQAFGYSIAILGMLYYKLGQKELKPYIAEAGRRWSEFGANRPVLRKLLVIGAIFTTVIIVLGGLAPTYAPEYVSNVSSSYLKNTLGTS